MWNLEGLGVAHQSGISKPFDGADGYGNWFWGVTPSCLGALTETAGFRIQRRAVEAFATTLVCEPVGMPFEHRLPKADEARELAAADLQVAGREAGLALVGCHVLRRQPSNYAGELAFQIGPHHPRPASAGRACRRRRAASDRRVAHASRAGAAR